MRFLRIQYNCSSSVYILYYRNIRWHLNYETYVISLNKKYFQYPRYKTVLLYKPERKSTRRELVSETE